MLPSQYHYIKRMWTRNYPRRGPGIISKIFWFPLKLCVFIIIEMIMTAFYVIGIAAWIMLLFIWQFLKVLFLFFKDLIIGLLKIIISNRKKEETKIIMDKPQNILYEVGKFIIETNEINIGTIQRTFKIGYLKTINVLDELTNMGVLDQNIELKNRCILIDIITFESMFNN